MTATAIKLCWGPGCRNALPPLKYRGHPRRYCSVRCRRAAAEFRRKGMYPPSASHNALPPELKAYLAAFDALLRARTPREVVVAAAGMASAPRTARPEQRELEQELPRALLPNHAEYQFLRGRIGPPHPNRSEDHA